MKTTPDTTGIENNEEVVINWLQSERDTYVGSMVDMTSVYVDGHLNLKQLVDILNKKDQQLQKARESERNKIKTALEENLRQIDFYTSGGNPGFTEVWEKVEESIDQPELETEDWSQCNDCFDGNHEKCIGKSNGCDCEHQSRLRQLTPDLVSIESKKQTNLQNPSELDQDSE